MLRKELRSQGHQASHMFEHINAKAKEFLKDRHPAIFVDTKEKEQVGD